MQLDPMGLGGPSAEWDSREGAPGWGQQVPRPKSLVEEELKEIWDLEHISQLSYRWWDCEMGVCPQTAAGHRCFRASKQHMLLSALRRAWSTTRRFSDRNHVVQASKEASLPLQGWAPCTQLRECATQPGASISCSEGPRAWFDVLLSPS